MVSKRRCFAVLLGLLFLVALFGTVPAFATEDGGLVPYAQDGYDDPVFFPTPQAPPTPTPEPTPTPTPEPTPTPTPTPEPPAEVTPAPQQPSGGGYTWETDPDPTPTPTPTPTPGAGGITVTPTPKPSDGPTPTTAPSVVRPVITPKPSGAGDTLPEDNEFDDGTNYVTFAQLNMKNNSLAVTLFYGGLALAVLGGGGLIFLILRIVKKRGKDDKFSVILEIEEAENRAPARIPSNKPELVTGPGRTIRVDPSHPRQASAARSSTPQTHPSRPPFPGHDIISSTQGFTLDGGAVQEPPAQSPENAPIVPSAASYFTEEFTIEQKNRSDTPVEPAAEPEEEPVREASPEAAPAAPQPSLASRLRAARARLPEQQEAASKPSASEKPAPQEEPEEPAPQEEPVQVEPDISPETPEALPEAPAPEEEPPQEAPEQPEEPQETPERQKPPKKPAKSEDVPEQLTFQQEEAPAESTEEPDDKEPPEKSGKEVSGQISLF